MTMAEKEKSQRPPAAPRIKVSKNGPYLVSGSVPLIQQVIVPDAAGDPCEWRTDKEYPSRKKYALCRCGQSKTLPFCDGTHTKAGFDGTETASSEPRFDQAKEIDGPTLRLTDAPGLCIGAAFCDRAGGTWKLTRQSDDPEARRIAIEEAGNCPSGRLVAWDKQGNAIEPAFEPSIAMVGEADGSLTGPIWVRGGIPLESADGTEYAVRNRVTLCGCGKSCNKPFCDGSHRGG
jgi:CDGSH-type Zn-finger protein